MDGGVSVIPQAVQVECGNDFRQCSQCGRDTEQAVEFKDDCDVSKGKHWVCEECGTTMDDFVDFTDDEN